MKKELCVKGRIIGKGKPLVCVPVMETNRRDIVDKVKRLVNSKTEMIEWRVDAFEQLTDLNAIREVLFELKPLVKDTILIYTLRTKSQGGLAKLTREQICDILQIGAESKTADFIDVEFFGDGDTEEEIRQLQKMGAYVIASHHDFDETPEGDILHMLLEQMNKRGADVVKIAVMPNDTDDVLSLLHETGKFHEMYPSQPLVTMSMGSLGCVSRIAGEIFGSCITFGAVDKVSAPGQLPADKLSQILDILHESVGNRI